MIRLRAPAKINLAHEVIGRRSDGYHEVRGVLQAIDLADELEIRRGDSLSLRVEPEHSVTVDDNLVLRAARTLRETAGVHAGATIVLHKPIPVAAGLGGGSSDAAATLVGLRRLWHASVSDERLIAIAASLGSDVPFFLRGGTAFVTGRGDLLRPLPSPVEPLAVIVTPEEPPPRDKTARLYGLLLERHFSDGSATAEVVRRIEACEELGGAMVNTFEQIAGRAYPSFEVTSAIFSKLLVPNPMLAGAGPSMFTLMHREADADAALALMNREDHTAVTASLLGAWGIDGLIVD